MERHKLLEFIYDECETSHEGGGDRQSPGQSIVSQGGTASIETAETADLPLLQEVLRESTLELAMKQGLLSKGPPGTGSVGIETFPEGKRAVPLEEMLARAVTSGLKPPLTHGPVYPVELVGIRREADPYPDSVRHRPLGMPSPVACRSL